MNANEPAMTIISPINAGILVVIGSKYLYLFLSVLCLLYQPVFGFNFLGAVPPRTPLLRNEHLRESLRHRGLTGGRSPT